MTAPLLLSECVCCNKPAHVFRVYVCVYNKRQRVVETEPQSAVCLALRRSSDVCLWPIISSQLPSLSVGVPRLTVTPVSVKARRTTATLNIPGHPWQSGVFLGVVCVCESVSEVGCLWRFIFKSKPPSPAALDI